MLAMIYFMQGKETLVIQVPVDKVSKVWSQYVPLLRAIEGTLNVLASLGRHTHIVVMFVIAFQW